MTVQHTASENETRNEMITPPTTLSCGCPLYEDGYVYCTTCEPTQWRINTPKYGYMPAHKPYTNFWRQHDKAHADRVATRRHLAKQALIIRKRGGQIKKADRHMTPETYAHLATQAAIIKSQAWRYPTLVAQTMAADDSGWGDQDTSCVGCNDKHDRLMHNCV